VAQKAVYQTITKNTWPNINAELLLVSRLEYTMRIVFCLVVMIVNIYDALSAITCFVRTALRVEREAQHITEQTTDIKSLWAGLRHLTRYK
jgi:hypothetical protein